jgi:transcriptional regulator with XRE-family HTH domain
MANKKNLYELLGLGAEKEKIEFQKELLHFSIIDEIKDIMGNMTYKELSKKMGYSQAYISKIFTGDKLLNLEFITKFQNVFGLITKIEFETKQEPLSFSIEDNTSDTSFTNITESSDDESNQTKSKVFKIHQYASGRSKVG